MHELSAYIAAALRKPLPAPVTEKTKHTLLDTLAAMVSGSRLLPGTKAIAYVKTLGGAKEAASSAPAFVTTVVNAALANGMLGHADETDDSHAPSLTHPGCGDRARGARDGRARAAQRHGAAARGRARLRRRHAASTCRWTRYEFREDGHSTHSFGPMFGAAAAAGALAGFDASQVRHLLSYTAQQASGVSCYARRRARRESVRLRRHAGAQRRRRRDHGRHGFTGGRRRVLRRAQFLRRVSGAQAASPKLLGARARQDVTRS